MKASWKLVIIALLATTFASYRCLAVASVLHQFQAGNMTVDEFGVVRESIRVLSEGAPSRVERVEATQLLHELDRVNYHDTPRALKWASEKVGTILAPKRSRDSDPKLLFSDEFDTLDHSVWEHEITMSGGGNWEFEMYINNRTNSYVRDGVLYMRPTLTADVIGEAALVNGGTMDLNGDTNSYSSCTDGSFYGCSRASDGAHIINPITSASIKTIKSFSFLHGRLEIRAKLPKGDWIWPAIWLLPKQEKYGKWPASGEIDLVESRGNGNGYPEGVDCFASTLHYGPFYPMDSWDKAHGKKCLTKGDFSTDFHTFGLKWSNGSLITYLDDESNVVLNMTTAKFGNYWKLGGYSDTLFNPWNSATADAPFDQEFFIKFNVAVGGTNSYWPDGVGNKPWVSTSPTAMLDFWNAKDTWYPTWEGESAAMQVDWIRVYDQ